jgi:hypothetical protein
MAQSHVDGSYIKETGHASVGIVIRDHTGHVVIDADQLFDTYYDAEEAKAIAAREGARLAAQWCDRSVIFESDCITITQAIQSKEQHLSHFKSIVHDFNMYVSNLSRWRCVHVKRDQNNVAHVIARFIMSTGLYDR